MLSTTKSENNSRSVRKQDANALILGDAIVDGINIGKLISDRHLIQSREMGIKMIKTKAFYYISKKSYKKESF